MSEIDLRPTEEMAANAERGLALREKHGRGGTEVGVARARDIKNRENLSPETVRRMHSYFARHEVDKKGEGWGVDSAGYIAWLLWGGDAGQAWVERKIKQLDDKQENARMERADQLAEMLMKPVTNANAKELAKAVNEAIALAKRNGDDDLLELAEEVGREIMAMKSRASRPGAKAKFDEHWRPEYEQRAADRINIAHNLMSKCEDKQREIAKTIKDLGKAINEMRDAVRRKDSTLLYNTEDKISDLDNVRRSFSRPGAKATMSAPRLYVLAYDNRDQHRIPVRSIAEGIEVLKQNPNAAASLIHESETNKRTTIAYGTKTGRANWTDAGIEVARAMKANAARPGAKAKFQVPPNVLKSIKAGIAGLAKEATRYDNEGDREMSEMRWKDVADLRKISAAIEVGDGSPAHAKRIASLLFHLDTELREWIGSATKQWLRDQRAINVRPGAKATMAANESRRIDPIMQDAVLYKMDKLVELINAVRTYIKRDEPFKAHSALKGLIQSAQSADVHMQAFVLPRNQNRNARPGAKAKFSSNPDVLLAQLKYIDDRMDTLRWEFHELQTRGMERLGYAIRQAKANGDDDAVQEASRQLEMIKSQANLILNRHRFTRPGAKVANSVREGEKVSASDDAVSRKIRKLMKEGKPQDQAVAIALDMKRRGEL